MKTLSFLRHISCYCTHGQILSGIHCKNSRIVFGLPVDKIRHQSNSHTGKLECSYLLHERDLQDSYRLQCKAFRSSRCLRAPSKKVDKLLRKTRTTDHRDTQLLQIQSNRTLTDISILDKLDFFTPTTTVV